MHEDWGNLDKLLAREQAGSFDFVFVNGDQGAGADDKSVPPNTVGEPINVALNA